MTLVIDKLEGIDQAKFVRYAALVEAMDDPSVAFICRLLRCAKEVGITDEDELMEDMAIYLKSFAIKPILDSMIRQARSSDFEFPA